MLLLLVLIPGLGHAVNGSRRWIRVGPVNFQPSEIARWLLLTYMAIYAVRYQAQLKSSAQGFFKPLAVLLAASILLLVEPDFGAAVVQPEGSSGGGCCARGALHDKRSASRNRTG